MTESSKQFATGESLTDAEMIKGFRRWLSSTKETEIERRWMLRACTLAEKQLASVPSEIAERPSAVYTSNESRLAHALREFIEASKRTEPKYGDCLALAEWTLNETSVSAIPRRLTVETFDGDEPAVACGISWIIRNHDGQPDHACATCVPGADSIIEGFICYYHQALELKAEHG